MDDNLNNNPIRYYSGESEDLKELELVDYALEFREVEKAYKLVSSVWDPENFKDPDKKNKAREKISKINEAYRRLKKAPTPVVETPKIEIVRPVWATLLIFVLYAVCSFSFLAMVDNNKGYLWKAETFEEWLPAILFAISSISAGTLSMIYSND